MNVKEELEHLNRLKIIFENFINIFAFKNKHSLKTIKIYLEERAHLQDFK